jgi:hypothetical protein
LARGHGGIRVEQPEATLTTTLAGEQLSTFQRLDEVAAILATGIQRLRTRQLGAGRDTGEQVRLDFPPERSVHADRLRPRRTAQ